MNWTLYSELLTANGDTKRDRIMNETRASILKRAQNSPAYKTVTIDGVSQNVTITSGSELTYKKINALPNEHIYVGSIVEWNNQHWLITETDCEDELYQRGTMTRCNLYLRWQNESGQIITRWAFSENLSLFNAGAVSAKVMDGIQQVYKLHLSVDSETIKIRRDKRFLIDLIHDDPNAYIVTNRDVVTFNTTPQNVDGTETFCGQGKILTLTLSQTQLTPADNTTLMIADYFTPLVNPTVTGGVTIQYRGQPEVKIGGSAKVFSAVFKDADGNVLSLTPVWDTTILDEFETIPIITESDNKLSIQIPDNPVMLGSSILVSVKDTDNTYSSEQVVEVVSIYG